MRRIALIVSSSALAAGLLVGCGSHDHHHSHPVSVVNNHNYGYSAPHTSKPKKCVEKKKYDRKGRLKSHKKVCK